MAGQPTKYKPEYCDTIKEYLADGYSVLAFAGHIGVTEQTIFNWAKTHPEFFEAKKIGQARAAAWWESALKNVAQGGEGNASACIFGVKNRASSEWRDRQEVAHDVSDPLAQLLSDIASNGKRIGRDDSD